MSEQPLLASPPRLSSPKTLYAVGSMGFFNAMGTGAALSIGLTWYVAHWSMSLLWSFNGSLVALTSEIIAAVIVGYYCDKTQSKYGRRKPYVVAASILKLVSMMFLCFPPTGNNFVLVGWYTLFYTLNRTGDGIYQGPFNTWLIESSADSKDYTKVYSTAMSIGPISGAIVGVIVVLASRAIFAIFYFMGLVISLSVIMKLLPSKTLTTAPPQPPLIPSLRICMLTREFRTIFYNRVLLNSAITSFSVAVAFYILIGLGLENNSTVVTYIIGVTLVGAAFGVIITASLNCVFKKHDKIEVYKIAMICAGVVCVATFFVMLNSTSKPSRYLYLSMAGCMGVIAMPVRLMDNLFTRDLVVYDTFVTEMNRENMYLAALSVPTDVLTTFVSAIPVLSLSLSGFSENSDVDDDNIDEMYDWTNDSLWVLRVFSTWFIFILIFFSYYLIKDYPLTTKIADTMNNVNKRNAQEQSPGQGSEKSGSRVQMDITDDERYHLLHLSVKEVFRIKNSSSDSKSKCLKSLAHTTRVCFALAVTNVIVLLTAFCTDLVILGGLFSLMLIVAILMYSFFILYLFLRRGSIIEMIQWDVEALIKKAGYVFSELSTQHESLKSKLLQEDFEIDRGSNQRETSICDPILDASTFEDGNPSNLWAYVTVMLVTLAAGSAILVVSFMKAT